MLLGFFDYLFPYLLMFAVHWNTIKFKVRFEAQCMLLKRRFIVDEKFAFLCMEFNMWQENQPLKFDDFVFIILKKLIWMKAESEISIRNAT